MKAVILAGGLGTRFAEETVLRPKPMIEIGGRPILWHIMMHYAGFGVTEFVITLGYKGEQIKAFFSQELALRGSLTADFRNGRVDRLEDEHRREDDWLVHLMETGVETPTGGRVARVANLVKEATFMLTFGDGVSNVDIGRLLEFHRSHGRLATVTAVRPPGRFGEMGFDGDLVTSFAEKPADGGAWISGGFFVLEPGVLDYVHEGDDWSGDCLPRLADQGQLMAYRHESFWQCMDTAREKTLLEDLWQANKAPWKTW
jgi:glucose-1-phosphate cytidylyltransferase